jgi:type II secretory pathway pseudopilin PulG
MHLIRRRLRLLATNEDGFTMLIALLALAVGGLLVAAAFTSANGDIKLSRTSTLQTKAYYAALAGVERYQYELNSNPNYWVECKTIPASPATTVKVPGTSDEEYSVKTLASAGHTACESGKQLTTLETAGGAKGTFRILSTGTSGGEKRSLVATFSHPGFTKYVYESNFEVEDPSNFNPAPTVCEHYYEARVKERTTGTCPPIQFANQDKVNGPMHTNDAAAICAKNGKAPTFGRTAEDSIEKDEGHYAAGGCSDEPNLVGKYTETAGSLLPPETDAELLEAAGYKFKGRTVIKLSSGTPNTMQVTEGTTVLPVKNFPTNGVVYVQNASGGCGITYTPFNSNTETDSGCGNVYVSGTYSESLTIASAGDVIVNGNLTTTATSSGEPTGGATLGLIAENFVRVYHPVEQEYGKSYKPNTASASGQSCSATSSVKINARVSNGSEEITELASTEELAVGDPVSGSGIASGTTIKTINRNGTSVILSKRATGSSSKTELTFTLPYNYFRTINKCVEEVKTGYTFHESELLDAEACKSASDKYVSGGKCEYQNSSSGCDAPNATAATDPNHWGSLENPVIDAAILSTNHSWIVDNYKCGEPLGELTVWGSIAQFWRGPVGTGNSNGEIATGYVKNYNYDERLAAQQPPSFLSPSSTSWKLSRETAPPTSFTG